MKKENLLTFLFVLSITNIFAQTWTPESIGFQDASSGTEKISIVDANVTWTVSGGYSSIHEFARTTDGGTTWLHGKIFQDSAKMFFSGIAAIDSLTAYVSVYTTPAVGGYIYKTIDGGSTWNQSGAGTVFTDSLSFPNDIYFWDAAHGIVYGDPIDYRNEIYTTSDSGNSWVKIPRANLPFNQYGSIYISSPLNVIDSSIWFINYNGQVMKSIDRGNNWTIISIDTIPNSSFYNICFLSDKLNGIATFSNSSYKTTDGGNTWTQFTPVGPSSLEYIKNIPGTNYFISVSSTNSVKCAYSNDTGNTWLPINTGFAGGDQPSGEIYKWDPGILTTRNDINEKHFSVYPNPSKDLIHIKCKSIPNSNSNIEVVNIFGQVIYSGILNTEETQIDLSKFSSGIYFLNIYSDMRREIFKIEKF